MVNTKALFQPTDDEIIWLVSEIVRLAAETPPNENADRLLALEVPTAAELATALNVTFWTSLQKEEGRNLLPSVYFGVPRSDLPQWELQTPIELTTKELAKLASGTDREKCCVGLRRNGRGGLEIWGISAVPATAGFLIQAVGPGSLVVQRQHRTLALLKPGNTLIRLSERGDFAPRALSAGFLRLRFPASEKNDFDLFLRQMLRAMTKRRMGGTLLIVRDDDSSWHPLIKSQYVFNRRPNLDDALRGYQGAMSSYVLSQPQDAIPEMIRWGLFGVGHNFREGWVSQIDSIMSVIARISSIDGAVVINANLELLEVGAKIIAPRPVRDTIAQWEVSGPNDENLNQTSKISLAECGGTRHQSAASFISSYSKGAAFVVSQDGKVSMFLADEINGVTMFRLEGDLL